MIGRAVVLMLAFVALPGVALAQTQTLATAGAWRTYGGTSNNGTPVCGMSTQDRDSGRELHVKFFRGSQYLAVQMFKASWRIPNSARMQVVIQIDATPRMQAGAVPVQEANGRGLQWNIGQATLRDFLVRFREGSRMTVSFPSGSEPSWVTYLSGTAEVLRAFSDCVRRAGGDTGAEGGPTQPFGGDPPRPEPTQPFGTAPQPAPQPVPTQPFGTPSPGPGGAAPNTKGSG